MNAGAGTLAGPAGLAGRTCTLPGSAGDMVVHVHEPPGALRGVALVAHGRNGAAGQTHLLPVIAACLDRGLAVVVPDLCHSCANASPGAADAFTMAAHLADVAAALDLAGRMFPADPLAAPTRLLIGHSMGAYAAVRIAAEHPDAVSGVLAISPVISGNALIAAREAMGPDALTALRREVPGALAEWPRHDLSGVAPAVHAPAAVIVGAEDALTRPADADTLCGWLPRCVYRQVVPGEHHCPTGPAYAASVGAALDRLIEAAA